MNRSLLDRLNIDHRLCFINKDPLHDEATMRTLRTIYPHVGAEVFDQAGEIMQFAVDCRDMMYLFSHPRARRVYS